MGQPSLENKLALLDESNTYMYQLPDGTVRVLRIQAYNLPSNSVRVIEQTQRRQHCSLMHVYSIFLGARNENVHVYIGKHMRKHWRHLCTPLSSWRFDAPSMYWLYRLLNTSRVIRGGTLLVVTTFLVSPRLLHFVPVRSKGRIFNLFSYPDRTHPLDLKCKRGGGSGAKLPRFMPRLLLRLLRGPEQET